MGALNPVSGRGGASAERHPSRTYTHNDNSVNLWGVDSLPLGNLTSWREGGGLGEASWKGDD